MSAREVTLIGGSPWGFRMHGGHDLHQPLRISRVNPGSKAAQQGVREGDLISSINGRSTKDRTNSEAHTLLRDAGDQLKLGLNQEYTGSPKRRIYKSSLQENTSIETVQKTTKTTTTSATRIHSSEIKKNVTDDTQRDFDLPTQNGSLKHAYELEKSGDPDKTIKRGPTVGYSCRHKYPSSDCTADCKYNSNNNNINYNEMPNGPRTRKNRRNRNKRLKHCPAATVVPVLGDRQNSTENYVELDKEKKKNQVDFTSNGDEFDRNEPFTSISASTSSIIAEGNKKLGEAKVNGQAVKVTEEAASTLNPVIGSIVEKRGPSWRRYKLKRGALNTQTKICEITSVSGLALEASIGHVAGVGILETGLTNNSNINQGLDSVVTITEPREPLKPLPSDVTSRVETLGERNFALALLPDGRASNKSGLEIHEVTDNTDIDMTTMDSSRSAIIFEAESDIEHEIPSEGTVRDIIVEENFVNDSDNVPDANNQQEVSNNVIDFVNEDELTEELMHAEKSGESNHMRHIKSGVGNEIRIYVAGPALPNFHEGNLLNNLEYVHNDSNDEASEQIIHRRSKKRAMLESYFSGEQRANRFLDIIQEEGERLSGDEEQHIRDFINAEIGKFQRDKRPTEVKCDAEEIKIEGELSDTRKNTVVNENAKLNCQQGNCTPNDCNEFVLKNEKCHSSADLENFAQLKYEKEEEEEKGEEESNPVDNVCEVPPLPTRSSSFINKDIELMQPSSSPLSVDCSPPPVPPLPDQTHRFLCAYSCRQPQRLPLPNSEILCREWEKVRSKNITCLLCNDVNEADKIGNDDDSVDEGPLCLKIDCDHVDFTSVMGSVPQKISQFNYLGACELHCNISPSMKSDAAASVEHRGNTAREDEVESSQLLQLDTTADEKKSVGGIELNEKKEEENAEKRRPLETQKRECFEEEGITSKNFSVEVEREIKEYITGISWMVGVADKSNKLFENNAKNSSEEGCQKFSQQFQTPIEYQKNESLKCQVVVENNQASVLNESYKVTGANGADSRGNFVDSSNHDSALNCFDDRIDKGSLSTSATSPSTVEYITQDICEIDSIQANLVNEEKSPKVKINLFGDGNDISKKSSRQSIPYLAGKEDFNVAFNAGNNYENTKSVDIKPEQLKHLCIKRILSMPYGTWIINEISLAKFNISKNLQTIPRVIESFESSAIEETVDVNPTDKMMKKTRPKSWMGVPTSVNPPLLVGLSPSPQKDNVRTSTDKVLDLHEKFFNRRSYHEENSSENRRRDINVPKYLMEVNSSTESMDLKEKSERNEWNQSNRVSAPSSNRLLKIIKENPIPSDSPQVTNGHKNVRQDCSQTTRLSDWLTLVKNDSTSECVEDEKNSDRHLSAKRCKYENGEVVMSTFSRELRTNDCIIISGHVEDSNDGFKFSDKVLIPKVVEDTSMIINGRPNNNAPRVKHINSALILQSSSNDGGSLESSSILQLNKSPINQNSAIIDKAPCVPDPPYKGTSHLSSGIIDSSRHVNSALINDKPEAPPRTRCFATVDRSCIDTTSIFDKSPPRSHLERRKYHNPQSLKKATTTEIIENLKYLQTTENMRDKIDGRRRHSLPQEIVDRQLKYIEQLENRLDKVMLVEEEEKERKAFEELHDHVEDVIVEGNRGVNGMRENETDDNYCENWHEDSRIEHQNHTQFITKVGHRSKKKCIVEGGGQEVERSTDIFENKEQCQQMTTRRWKNDANVLEPKMKELFHNVSTEKFPDNIKIKQPQSISISPMTDEMFRCQMYNEYIDKVLERKERKHHKVIKISSHVDISKANDKSNITSMNNMEKEFIERAKDRMIRFGINFDVSESEKTVIEETKSNNVKSEVEITKCERNGDKAKCLIDGKEIKDAGQLPKHLQELLVLASNDVVEDGYGYGNATGEKTNAADLLHEIDKALKVSKGFLLRKGVWSPCSEPPPPPKQPSPERGKNTEKDGGIPPVWTPSSASASPVTERKEFRPVSFESPILSRKQKSQSSTDEISPSTTRWRNDDNDHLEDTKKDKDITSHSIAHNITRRIVNSHSVPSQGLNTLVAAAAAAPRLPRAQNPTITLLQKAREGQLPKGAAYLDETVNVHNSQDTTQVTPNEIMKQEYENKADVETQHLKKMMNLGVKKIKGIGPITKSGMPVALRSEVEANNQAKWYKQMYDSLHRAGKDDDYVTIRYKPRRGTRYGYGTASGYLSEPEPRAYIDRSVTLDTRRRQRNKENDSAITTMPRKSAVVKTTAEVYRNKPGRIENYEPGRSSIGEKETKEWWNEVMDIFDGADKRQLQLQHPMALRTFIPTHQLMRTSNKVQSTSLSSPTTTSPTTTVTPATTTTTQSLHPKSSLRTTRAVLEYVDPETIKAVGTTALENRQASLINLHLGRPPKSIVDHTINTKRMSYSLVKLPKNERGTSTKNRQRHSRENKSSRETHNDDAIVIGFIDETMRSIANNDNEWQSLLLEGRSKSFVMPNSVGASRRLSPLIGNRMSSINKERLYLPMTSPRNHHRNHHHRQHHDPSISSSTSSSSSSTIHITMLPPPPPPPPPPITNNTTTTVIAETALTSPLTSRPFDQRNQQTAKPYMSHALKESGYESDSTLIFRRRDDASPLSPLEQRLAYKTVQKGGDVPLHGFRKPAPERPKDDTEIQYFPITSTLTRIRVRRRNLASLSTTPSSMSTSLTFPRSNKSVPPLIPSSIIPLSRANIGSEIIQLTERPPSPPRRQSSRHNATLKLYISTSHPQTCNRRHEQCFSVKSASTNIRFLRERLSNKLLKHEQRREHRGIVHKCLTSLQSPSPMTLASRIKTKPSTRSPSTASKCSNKVESYLSKPPPEYHKSINSIGRIAHRKKCIVDSEQTSKEDKPPNVQILLKSPSSTDTSERFTVRSKSLQSCQKKDQAKNLKTKRETVKCSKRGSFANSSSPVEVERLLNSRRQVVAASTLTGSVIKTNSTLRRQRSRDIGLSKVISKSCELKKTAAPSSVVRSRSPTTTLISTIKPKTRLDTITKSKLLITSKLNDKNIEEISRASIVFENPEDRKQICEKPQTRMKTIIKKSDTAVDDKQVKTAKNKDSMRGEKTRDVTKTKKNSEKIECARRTNMKPCGKCKIETSPEIITRDQVTPALTMDRVKRHHETARSNNFFKNLFLRDVSSPTPSQCSTLGRRSSVMERARIFQELGKGGFKSEPSLRTVNVYLATKRPVSNSRFKNWERESLSSRSSSPCGVGWPGRSAFHKISKFDSLQEINDFGSYSSLRGRSPDTDNDSVIKERSLSEPPLKLSINTNKPKIITSQGPSRSSSPSPLRSQISRRIRTLKKQATQESLTPKTRARSASGADYNGNQSNRSVNLGSDLSLTKSTSSLESPPINRDDYQRYVFEILHSKKKSTRYKDLHDFYASLERMGELEKSTSTNDLRRRLKNEDIIDYDRWKELRCKERAEVELNNLYGKLKAVQREKDFLFSTKDVERYRWKGDCGLRCKERSVENIRESFQRLVEKHSESASIQCRDIASKKDVYKPLWRGNSVVDVANTMTRRAVANGTKHDEDDKWSVRPSLRRSLGGSKKFWSSLSVEQVNVLKNQLNEIYGSENMKGKISRKSSEIEAKITAQKYKKTMPIETSMIKSEFEVIVPPSNHAIVNKLEDVKGLSVRCHSSVDADIKSTNKSSSLKRSGSISNGTTHHDKSRTRSFTEMEKKRLSLTLGNEIMDKVLQRRYSKSAGTPQEKDGAIAVTSLETKTKNTRHSTAANNASPRTYHSLEESLDHDSLSKVRDKNDFVSVITPSNKNNPASRMKVETVLEEWSRKSPLLAMARSSGNEEQNRKTCTSEIDSLTEISANTVVKTVVQFTNEMDVVPKKVEFYESIEREQQIDENESYLAVDTGKKKKSVLSSSQSFADLKELFGEKDSAHNATLPLRSQTKKKSHLNVSCCVTSPSGSETIDGERARGGRSTSVPLNVPSGRVPSASHSRYHHNDRSRSVSPCRVSTSSCSLESIRHRSISPDPERYWRTYLSLVRHGAVKKLRARFESLEELSSGRGKFSLEPKRFQSDPELTRNYLNRIIDDKESIFKCQNLLPDVGGLRRKYAPSRARIKRRVTRSPPIPRIPLRLEDLAMPHINIISKTAELKDSTISRSSSSNSLAFKAETEEIEALRPVGRIREKFEQMEIEKTSILGEMFTSAPNVHELRDIAPYLAGRWVAHKYPNREDKTRSLSLPPGLRNSGGYNGQRAMKRTSGTSELVKSKEDKIKGPGIVSSSPASLHTPTSILKQPQADAFADQPFDASKHRPRYRYQPPPPPPPPPLPPSASTIRCGTKAWWPPIPTYTARPTVTFEGPR